jgi:sugar phosphate isomerase/epimerase
MLGKRIRQVHLKDAIASEQPGQTWGREVPFGQGQVNVPAFMAVLRDIQYRGPLIFEREGGKTVSADIAAGIQALRKTAGE